MSKDNRFAGKVALVTGGNSGIGKATARRLAAEGAEVIITGRDAERVKEASAELGIVGLVADQGSIEAIDRLVQDVSRLHERVDILFVNAGVFYATPIPDFDEATFDEIMNINFKGAIFTLQRFLPLLGAGASVINLSSINAYAGMANTAVYAASKAALNSYTRVAATELAPRKIRVNAVNPGPVETPIFGKTGMTDEQLEGFGQAMRHRVPLKSFGTPEAIASVVAYLASDEAQFVTGAEWTIDGGVSINPILLD